jgi:phage protein D
MPALLTPAYRLTVGDRVVDTTDEPRASTVVELAVELSMDAPADRFVLELAQVGSFQPELGDEATIELGYAPDEEATVTQELVQVMAGSVVEREPGLVTERVIGFSAAHALLHTFVDQTYEEKTAGAIVRDLADRAGVATATVEDGETFPAYVVDGRASAWHHARELADLQGFDLYVDAEGALVFQRFAGGSTAHVFEFAKHILALDRRALPERAATVRAIGESPGASRGDESWAWLTKDFSRWQGEDGSGDPVLLLERPALRTTRTAALAAIAALTAIRRRAVTGRLLALGRPQVKLGDALRIAGVPEEGVDGTDQVRAVTHRLHKERGFTTEIGFRGLALGGAVP